VRAAESGKQACYVRPDGTRTGDQALIKMPGRFTAAEIDRCQAWLPFARGPRNYVFIRD